MRAVIVCESKYELARVYRQDVIDELTAIYGKMDCVNKASIMTGRYTDCEIIFSTWSMSTFTAVEIDKYLPSVKYLFYAAGAVQSFAKPFLERGVRVFSAWKANALPVAEFTVAEIMLAAKGYYRAMNKLGLHWNKVKFNRQCKGNYELKVGLLGVGGVGTLVANRLANSDIDLYCYDKYLTDERASELNVTKKDLGWIFANCDIVSNHLANKPELNKIIGYDLIASMPKYSAFINTGRGAQVDEKGLAKALARDKTKTALLDVTNREPLSIFSRLRWLSNVVLTPHIAGSSGVEVVRMSKLMVDVANRVLAGDIVDCEVTIDMLATMA